MGAVGKGDWVECVGAETPNSLNLGRVFQVEGISSSIGRPHDENGCDGSGLILAEMKSDSFDGAFCACCFRPIYRPDPKLIERLMEAPVTEPVRVPVKVGAFDTDPGSPKVTETADGRGHVHDFDGPFASVPTLDAAWDAVRQAERMTEAVLFEISMGNRLSELFSKQGV